MKKRIYPRLVIGDENEITGDEILWIEGSDGLIELKQRNNNGELMSLTKSVEEEEEEILIPDPTPPKK